MVNVKSVLFLVGVYLFWNLVAGAMGFFMPFVYETVGGLSNTQANLLQAVLWILTAASTYFGFAKFGDPVSHRGLFFVGALMAVASWVVLTFVGMSWVGLWTFVILWVFQQVLVHKLFMHFGPQNFSQQNIVVGFKA